MASTARACHRTARPRTSRTLAGRVLSLPAASRCSSAARTRRVAQHECAHRLRGPGVSRSVRAHCNARHGAETAPRRSARDDGERSVQRRARPVLLRQKSVTKIVRVLCLGVDVQLRRPCRSAVHRLVFQPVWLLAWCVFLHSIVVTSRRTMYAALWSELRLWGCFSCQHLC
jgi:hypothetical protein